MGKLIFSGFTDEYAESFCDQVSAAKAFGMDAIELRNADGMGVAQMTLPQVERYRQMLQEAGLGVSAIGSPLGKIPLDGDLGAHWETARKIFAFANILGTDNVRIFSFYSPKSAPIDQCKNAVLDNLGHLLELANSAGVTLCHENEAGIYGSTPQRCLELLEHFGGKLKCVFDMGNFVLEQEDPLTAYALLVPHIRYFHIKDALAAGAVVPPGKGEAQIQKIIAAHKQSFSGDFVITLEPHLQTFSGLHALATRKFENPYQYPDLQTAFADAVNKLKELIRL